MQKYIFIILAIAILCGSCNQHGKSPKSTTTGYRDEPYLQDYSIRFLNSEGFHNLRKVIADRNGNIQIISQEGILKPGHGDFLFPGKLVKDRMYRPLSDLNISGIGLLEGEAIYLSNKAVLSNTWVGKMYSSHNMPGAKLFAAGKDLNFLVSDGSKMIVVKDCLELWSSTVSTDKIIDIKYDPRENMFWILAIRSLYCLDAESRVLSAFNIPAASSCFEIPGDNVIIGTSDGLFVYSKKQKLFGEIISGMPSEEITSVRNINGRLWIGSNHGAFRQGKDRKYSYYASERWLPSDTVTDISPGPDNSVLVLTTGGLAQICFKEMTLAEKAGFYEKQVRSRHIRYGFNATFSGMQKGDVTSGTLEDSDNDGLWTSMYLAAETFRYAVTGSGEALQNIRESLDAMERLYSLTKIPGFPARSFERRGYKYDDKPWRRADDPGWDWKSTTSSDEAIGHVFAFGVIAELISDKAIKTKAISLLDTLMSNILKNDLYLVDFDGKPTRWGRWNPEYVNGFPEMIGDRKLNSSNIIGMLQTAYRFTGKEKYRSTAFNLMDNYGYFKNLMKPMSGIGIAPHGTDSLSMLLSEGWNHSDDEMYFLGYWGLFRYAFNDSLKSAYEKAIIDHLDAERPEKDALWNIMAAMTGTEKAGFDDAVWYLKEYPMDLIEWNIKNSHRKDIEILAPNFRNQLTKELLPPDELRIARHNSNRFILDGGDDGSSEMSAGDIWLLPYWMGRYLGVISEPVNNSL
jgi:hypothetical protein